MNVKLSHELYMPLMNSRIQPGSAPTVVIYGPDPDNSRRIGGVATAVVHLKDAIETAGLASISLFTDLSSTESSVIPGVIQRFLGVSRAVRTLNRLPDGNYAVHAHTSLYPRALLRDLPFLRACRQRGLPVLLQIHGGRLGKLHSTSFGRMLSADAFRCASALGVFPGPQWTEFAKADVGIPLVEMLNIVPTSSAPTSARGEAVFLFLGRLTRDKGILELVASFEKVALESDSDVRLIIAGDGPLRTEVESAIEASSAAKQMQFVGFVSGQEKQALLDSANVFVLPSKHEGFPFSFMECAEKGMACLVTSNSAIPSVFEDGKEFQSLDVNDDSDVFDHMKVFAANNDRRIEMGAAARQAVHRLCSPEVQGSKLAQLYAEMAARRVSNE